MDTEGVLVYYRSTWNTSQKKQVALSVNHYTNPRREIFDSTKIRFRLAPPRPSDVQNNGYRFETEIDMYHRLYLCFNGISHRFL